MARVKKAKTDTGANVGYEAQLWQMADALRGSMDAAEYKHVVLGLIFLKYISDAFEEQHARLEAEEASGADPEDRDEYRAASIFWVPPEARWAHLKAQARQSTIGQLVDDAMAGIERDNTALKGVLPKDYARPALDKARLGQLVDLVSNIKIGDEASRAKDALGRVYEYFLSQFASAEGKKGGEFYTPRCVVRLLVEMLEPYRGRVYDNLPEVLSNIQANPDLFDEYISRVREVFPIVESITVRSAINNQVEIRVWQLPGASRRDDLAFPLNECGTGIGQVLAILYVAMASDDPQIILIDEPNSFLHPGAARALIRALRQFPRHQYVIATHAPEIISEAGDCPVIQVQWANGESTCERYPARTSEISRRLLVDVGARLSDVFGFDEVLWVEGPSDQACINALLKARFPPRPGLAVLPVRDTGNFYRRRARDIVAIYRQASMASALVPPTIGFLLDRDNRGDRDVEQIIEKTAGAVSFLPRAMIENYLLNAHAIVDVLKAESGDAAPLFQLEDVESWIRAHGSDREYQAVEYE